MIPMTLLHFCLVNIIIISCSAVQVERRVVGSTMIVFVLLALLQLVVSQTPLCFENSAELKTAVQAYIADSSETSTVAVQYGHPIGVWCLGPGVTDLQGLFTDAVSFNEDLSAWDTSNVEGMNDMFSGASSFNQNIASWDTSRVTDFESMFFGAIAFNQPIGIWDVSSGKSFARMFQNAVAFNQDISSWTFSAVLVDPQFPSDTVNPLDLDYILAGAASFSQNLCDWGPKLPADGNWTAILAFENTACPLNTEENSTPSSDIDPPGPFCNDCGGVAATNATTVTPSPKNCPFTDNHDESICALHLSKLNKKILCDCYNFCNGQLLSCCDESTTNATCTNLQCSTGQIVGGCQDADRNAPLAPSAPSPTRPPSSAVKPPTGTPTGSGSSRYSMTYGIVSTTVVAIALGYIFFLP